MVSCDVFGETVAFFSLLSSLVSLHFFASLKLSSPRLLTSLCIYLLLYTFFPFPVPTIPLSLLSLHAQTPADKMNRKTDEKSAGSTGLDAPLDPNVELNAFADKPEKAPHAKYIVGAMKKAGSLKSL